ncbi:MAG: peptidyl-prolyl cis-trans isomerase [Planctomycetia bacterium]|nr:peptidyl-prolyl cis-trans isomerase [Planctomycetia bacterium]
MFHVCLGVVALCGPHALEAGAAAADNPVVVLDTTLGAITIELDQARAPVTVDNFLKYVDSGFYDNLVFHRVMPDFMVQGGGLDDKLREKSDGLRPPIKNEAGNGLTNQRGTLAMARTSNPNSATAQFFINLVDNSRNLGPGGVDDYGYAVFGKVTDGMDVVDKIAQVQTAQRGPHGNVPLRPVYIKSARRKGKS